MTPRSQHQSRNCSNQISQQQEGLPACTPSSKQHPSSDEYVQINAASWNSYLLACVPWWTSLRSWAAPTCTALLLLLWRAARKPWRSPHRTAMISCGDTRGWQSPSMTRCKTALQGAAAISSQPHLAFHAAGSSFLSASLLQTDLFLFFQVRARASRCLFSFTVSLGLLLSQYERTWLPLLFLHLLCNIFILASWFPASFGKSTLCPLSLLWGVRLEGPEELPGTK